MNPKAWEIMLHELQGVEKQKNNVTLAPGCEKQCVISPKGVENNVTSVPGCEEQFDASPGVGKNNGT
jgi:hypothetical protein